MGLDSFWALLQGTEPPRFDPPLRLCGGMLSGDGNGSFRGKVDNCAVSGVAGISLYQERMPNADARRIATALEDYLATGDGGFEYDEWPPRARRVRGSCREEIELRRRYTDAEWADLARMFRAYADLGAELIGWW
jgi:hypothetical protein